MHETAALVRPFRPRFSWVSASVAGLVFAVLALNWYHAPIVGGLKLSVTFAPGVAGESLPLITVGETGNGEFLFARYVGPRSLVLGYDRWGAGGPVSTPLAITPGKPYALVVELPSLGQSPGNFSPPSHVLHVSFDGRDALFAEARQPARNRPRVFIGENPIGGSSCGPRFSGQILAEDGRLLRGRLTVPPWPQRVVAWLRHGWPQGVMVLLGAVLVGYARSLPLGFAARSSATWIYIHRWFVATAVACVIVFSWMLTGGTWRFLFPESFGSFYDYQAVSLLQGHFDVPQEIVSGEAFIIGGKYYGYFGVTPALLRLPWVIFDVAFGEWSRLYVLGFYMLSLIGAYLVLCEARRQIVGRDSAPPVWLAVAYTLHVGLGSTLLFLAGRAYIYHEAAIGGVAFALGAVYFSLRQLAAPDRRWWLGAWACGLLSVHARPSIGLFALALPACVALAALVREWPRPAWGRHVGVAALCVAGVLSFNALSFLKFGTFDGAPLKYHIQYSPARLAYIEGRNFHLSNVPYNFGTYVWFPAYQFRPTFPYFMVAGWNSRSYAGTKNDVAEATLGLPYIMPGLVLFAVVGAAGLFALRRESRVPLLVLWGAAVPMTAAMLTAVAVSQRYTADFCPLVFASAAFALVAIELCSPVRIAVLRLMFVVLTLGSILLMLAITLRFQNELVWGVPDEMKQHYLSLRTAADKLFGLDQP